MLESKFNQSISFIFQALTFSVIFFRDVEGVEKVVVIVDAEVDRSGSRLNDLLEVLKHVHIRKVG